MSVGAHRRPLRRGEALAVCDTVTVPDSSADVAAALRQIADRVEAEDLCLVGLWNTGFGEPSEVCLQVVYDADTFAVEATREGMR